MKLKEAIHLGLALLCLSGSTLAADYPSKASKDERRALDELASEIEGSMIYTHKGRIKKITVGDWRTQDIGEGDFVRWGPLGERIAVIHHKSIYVVKADGSDRKRVVDGGVEGGDGCQMEFHPNGREIIYGTRRNGTWIVDIESGKKRDMKLPFNTEFNISADGEHLVLRRGDCFLVELPGTKYRKYAGGCSPCVSPDGTRMTSNKGGHRTMDIQEWNGKRLLEINAKKMGPDHRWDNMHWSNHNDIISMQGDGKIHESYAFRVSKNEGTRLSWEGRTKYPDFFVSKDLKTGEIPMHMTVAWRETKGGQSKIAHTDSPNPQKKKPDLKPKKSGEVESEILALTGSPTRVVWCQARSGDHFGKDSYLMGVCTEDGRGEHRILSDAGNYAKPFLTPDGTQIVYSDRQKNRFFVVNWDGSKRRELGSGYASDAWRDPSDGKVWLYYRAGDGRTKGGVKRLLLDNPKVKEKVWEQTPTGHNLVPWFRLSADGTHAASAFPYSNCGVADLVDGKWEKYGNGCWASIAPDNSYRYFNFHGSHREIGFFDAGKQNFRKINVAGGPGVGRSKVYFPRWSNDVGFLTVTGPKFTDKQEILLGRFGSDFTKVDKWVKISRNDKMDLYGDAWTQRGWEVQLGQDRNAEMANQSTKKGSAPEQAKFDTWPGDQSDLIFLWENNNATNQIDSVGDTPGRLCRIKARDRAIFGRHYEMILTEGSVDTEEIGAPLAQACRTSNELTVEATITAHGNDSESPAKIISSTADENPGNFSLVQNRDKLEFHLRTSKGQQRTELCTIEPGRPHHVLVSYRPGHLVAYLDSKKIHETDRVAGDLNDWKPLPLVFGSGTDWNGSLEGVTIYAREISTKEAQLKHNLYAARLRDRKPIEALEVEAKLVEVTPTPAVEALQEYTRGLVFYAYEIKNVLKGSEKVPKIQVAHWAILDRKLLPEMGTRSIGKTYRLKLESHDSHPQLKSERSFNDCEDFDIPLYYETGHRTANGATLGKNLLKRPEQNDFHLKVNCGGAAVDDWQNDNDFLVSRKHGQPYNFKMKTDVSSVSAPAPLEVYTTVRHRDHSYAFDVPDGEYLVRLHFADYHDDNGTIRKMDFVIENERALKGFNVVAAAGGTGKAVVREIPVSVTDGNGLQIRGEDTAGGDVFAAGIEIVSR